MGVLPGVSRRDKLGFVAVAYGVGHHLDGGEYSSDLARRIPKGLSGHYNASDYNGRLS